MQSKRDRFHSIWVIVIASQHCKVLSESPTMVIFVLLHLHQACGWSIFHFSCCLLFPEDTRYDLGQLWHVFVTFIWIHNFYGFNSPVLSPFHWNVTSKSNTCFTSASLWSQGQLAYPSVSFLQPAYSWLFQALLITHWIKSLYTPLYPLFLGKILVYRKYLQCGPL